MQINNVIDNNNGYNENEEDEEEEDDEDGDQEDELAVLTGMAPSRRAGAINTSTSNKASRRKKSSLLKDKNLVHYAFDDQNDVQNSV